MKKYALFLASIICGASLLFAAGTDDNSFIIGDSTSGEKRLSFDKGPGGKPGIRFNNSSNYVEKSDNGVNYSRIVDGQSIAGTITQDVVRVENPAVGFSGPLTSSEDQGQTFTPTTSFDLAKWNIFLTEQGGGSPGGSMTVTLYEASESGGTVTPGTLVATSNAVTSFPDNQYIEFVFSSPPTLTASQLYLIVYNTGSLTGTLSYSRTGDLYAGGSLVNTIGGGLYGELALDYTFQAIEAVPPNINMSLEGDTIGSVDIGVPDTVSTPYVLVLPDAQGSAGEIPQNDGQGNLSWQPNYVTQYEYLAKSTALLGFTGGTCYLERINKYVNITCDVLNHGSSSAPSTTAGFLPTWARPNELIFNTYLNDGTGVYSLRATTTGELVFNYRNWSGGNVARTDTGTAASINFSVP